MGNCGSSQKTLPADAQKKSLQQPGQNQNHETIIHQEKKAPKKLAVGAGVQPDNNREKLKENNKEAPKAQNQPNQNRHQFNFSSWLEDKFGTPTSEEMQLVNLINKYRKEKGLKPVFLSASLTKVAQIHARDVVENSPDLDGGNMHSWSDRGPWKPCQYTSDHKQAALMWSKPSELTNYKGNGIEIAHGYVENARKINQVTARSVIEAWKKSSSHNAVIIEDEIWKGKNFQALGVGIYKGFACVWFGTEPDLSSQQDHISDGMSTASEDTKTNKASKNEIEQEQSTQNKNQLRNVSSWLQENFGTPNSEEMELVNLINKYRKEKGLKPVFLSASLTKVAQIHARDVVENSPDLDGGNMHSWSDRGPWKPCQYTSDHKQAALMWSKPSELTNYKGNGIEIAHGYVENARKVNQVTARSVIEAWKKSSSHNAVIIEDEIWKGKNFQALGVSIYKGFACAWFGTEPDPVS